MKEDKQTIIIGVIIIVVILLVGGYIGYKLYIYAYYHDNTFASISDHFKIADTIDVNTVTLPSEEYLLYDNIKIKNEFDGYEKIISNNMITYINRTRKGKLVISKEEDYLNGYFLKENLGTYGDGKKVEDDIRINYLKRNNIKNDYELFAFLSEDNYKNNIFTSTKNIKGSYATYLLASTLNNYTLYIIDGNLEGYILEGNDMFEVDILKDNMRYSFTFSGSYFNKDKVLELLNTIVID